MNLSLISLSLISLSSFCNSIADVFSLLIVVKGGLVGDVSRMNTHLFKLLIFMVLPRAFSFPFFFLIPIFFLKKENFVAYGFVIIFFFSHLLDVSFFFFSKGKVKM